jgi:hypothetical protein
VEPGFRLWVVFPEKVVTCTNDGRIVFFCRFVGISKYNESKHFVWAVAQLWLSLTHGAEPFLRSRQLCSHSRTSQDFMEPGGLLPYSQETSTGPYPEPGQFNPYYPILSLWSVLILSTHLRLGLPTGLQTSVHFNCFVVKKTGEDSFDETSVEM